MKVCQRRCYTRKLIYIISSVNLSLNSDTKMRQCCNCPNLSIVSIYLQTIPTYVGIAHKDVCIEKGNTTQKLRIGNGSIC